MRRRIRLISDRYNNSKDPGENGSLQTPSEASSAVNRIGVSSVRCFDILWSTLSHAALPVAHPTRVQIFKSNTSIQMSSLSDARIVVGV